MNDLPLKKIAHRLRRRDLLIKSLHNATLTISIVFLIFGLFTILQHLVGLPPSPLIVMAAFLFIFTFLSLRTIKNLPKNLEYLSFLDHTHHTRGAFSLCYEFQKNNGTHDFLSSIQEKCRLLLKSLNFSLAIPFSFKHRGILGVSISLYLILRIGVPSDNEAGKQKKANLIQDLSLSKGDKDLQEFLIQEVNAHNQQTDSEEQTASTETEDTAKETTAKSGKQILEVTIKESTQQKTPSTKETTSEESSSASEDNIKTAQASGAGNQEAENKEVKDQSNLSQQTPDEQKDGKFSLHDLSMDGNANRNTHSATIADFSQAKNEVDIQEIEHKINDYRYQDYVNQKYISIIERYFEDSK